MIVCRRCKKKYRVIKDAAGVCGMCRGHDRAAARKSRSCPRLSRGCGTPHPELDERIARMTARAERQEALFGEETT